MAEGRQTEESALPLQTAYRVIWVAIVGAALYTVGELATTFEILFAILWMVIGLSLPTLCVIGVVHSRGDQRAFFIGTLFPAALTLSVAVTLFVVMTFDPDDMDHFDFSSIGLPIAWFLTVGCGSLAMRIAKSLAGARKNKAAAGSTIDASAESPRLIWQFSLWTLMIAMTLCAVACAIVFVLPPAFSVVICLILWAVAPIAVTIPLIYGDARRRDFWIGAALPTAVGFAAVTCVFVIVTIDDGPWFFGDNDLALGLRIVTFLLFGSILLMGMLATILGRRIRSQYDQGRNPKGFDEKSELPR